jgi:uncharacterized protein YkwD
MEIKAVFLPLFAALGATVAAPTQSCPDLSAGWREEVQLRINALRSEGESCARPTAARLQWSSELERLAEEQAGWVAQRGQLEHTGRDGTPLGERVRTAGYRYTRVAENLAWGTASLDETLELWRRSEGHCRNLFDDRVTELALVCRRGPGGPWWVMTLGRPQTR